MHVAIEAELEKIAKITVDAGLTVHRELGPGLLESAYEHCLVYELTSRSISVSRQVELPITYRGIKLDVGYRLDIIIENKIIVEIKAVDSLTPIHHAQLLTYLKLSGCKLGFLMNFHAPLFKQGLKRLIL